MNKEVNTITQRTAEKLRKGLGYKKYIAAITDIIIQKDSLQLSKEDISEALKIAGLQNNILQSTRYRRLMQTDIVQSDINNVLISKYQQHDITEDKMFSVLHDAIKIATNKGHSSTLFEIYKHLSEVFGNNVSKVKVTQQEQLNTNQELTSISRTITKEVNE